MLAEETGKLRRQEERASDSFLSSFISQTFIKCQQCWAAQPCPGGAQSPMASPRGAQCYGATEPAPRGVREGSSQSINRPAHQVHLLTGLGGVTQLCFLRCFPDPSPGHPSIPAAVMDSSCPLQERTKELLLEMPYHKGFHCRVETQLMVHPRAPRSGLAVTAFCNTVQETPQMPSSASLPSHVGHETPLRAAVLRAVSPAQ